MKLSVRFLFCASILMALLFSGCGGGKGLEALESNNPGFQLIVESLNLSSIEAGSVSEKLEVRVVSPDGVGVSGLTVTFSNISENEIAKMATPLTPTVETDAAGFAGTFVKAPNQQTDQPITIQVAVQEAPITTQFSLQMTIESGTIIGLETSGGGTEVAGTPFDLIVSVRDDLNRVVETFNGEIELTWGFETNNSWAGLTPTVPQNVQTCIFVKGVCTVNGNVLVDASTTTFVWVGDGPSDKQDVFAYPITVVPGAAATVIVADGPNGPAAGASPVASQFNITADDAPITFYGSVTDIAGNYIEDSASITWSTPDTEVSDYLSATSGAITTFTPTRTVVASALTASLPGATSDIVNFRVDPGAPDHLRVELPTGTLQLGGTPFEVLYYAVDAKDNPLTAPLGGNGFTASFTTTVTVQNGVTVVPPSGGVSQIAKSFNNYMTTGTFPQTFLFGLSQDNPYVQINDANADGATIYVETAAENGFPMLSGTSDTITIDVGPAARMNIWDAPGPAGNFLCNAIDENNGSSQCSFLQKEAGSGPYTIYAVAEDAGGNFVSNQSVTWEDFDSFNGEISAASGTTVNFSPANDGGGSIRLTSSGISSRYYGTTLTAALDHYGIWTRQGGDINIISAPTTFSLEIEARDISNNLVNLNGVRNIQITASGVSSSPSGTSAVIPGGFNAVSFVNGRATVNGLLMPNASDTPTLSIADDMAIASSNLNPTTNPGPLAILKIRDAVNDGGTDLTNLNFAITTDSSQTLVLNTYDSEENFRDSAQSGVWSGTASALGALASPGIVSTFEPTTTGTGVIDVDFGGFSASTGTITVDPGALDHLRVVTEHGDAEVAGTAFTVSVQFEDAENNVLTNFNGAMDLDISILNTGTTRLGHNYSIPSNGTYNFVNGVLSPAQSFTIFEATATPKIRYVTQTPPIKIGETADIAMTPNNPDHIYIQSTQTDILAGDTLTYNILVEDEWGNITTQPGPDTTQVTINFDSALGGQDMISTNLTSATDISGGADSSVTGNVVGGQATIDLTATQSGTLSVTGSFAGMPGTNEEEDTTVNPRPTIASVEYTPGSQPPAVYTASNTVPLPDFDVRILDTYGNVITTNSADSIQLSLSAGTGSLGGTLTQTVTNGEATFSGITYPRAEAITLRATHVPSGQFADFNITVNPGPAIQTIAILPGQSYQPGVANLANAVTGSPSAQTAGVAFNVSIRAVDDGYNTVTTFSGNTQAVPNDSHVGAPAQQAFVNGETTFSTTLRTAGASHVITGTGLGVNNPSTTFTLNPNVGTQLVLTLPGQSLDSGAANLASAIVGGPSVQSVGSAFTVRAHALDDYFNVVNDNSTSVTLSFADPNASYDGASVLSAGIYDFSVTYLRSFTSTTMSPTSTYTDVTSDAFAMNFLAASQILAVLPGQAYTPGQSSLANAVTGTPSQQTAGVAFNVDVYAVDTYFNTVTTSTNLTNIPTSDPNDTEPSAKSLTAGQTTFSVTNITAGTGLNMTPNTGGAIGAELTSSNYDLVPNTGTQTIAVLPGQAFSPGKTVLASAVTGTPTGQTAGVPFNVDLYAVDNWFNQVDDDATVVNLTTDDPHDTEPSAETLVDGHASFSVDLRQAGSRTVQGSSALTDNVSSTVTLSSQSATQTIVLLPGESLISGPSVIGSAIVGSSSAQTAGDAFDIDVYAVDPYFNIDSSYISGFSITTSDVNDSDPGAGTFVGGSATVSITNVTATTGSTAQITPSSGLATNNLSNLYAINPNSPTKLITVLPTQTHVSGQTSLANAVIGAAPNQMAGQSFTATVIATDNYYNKITSDSSTSVSLGSSDTYAVVSGPHTLSSGQVTFNVENRVAVSQNLTASGAGYSGETSDNYTVDANTSQKNLIAVLPNQTLSPGPTSFATAISGTPTAQVAGIGFSVEVRATDNFFNTRTDLTDLVNLSTSDPSDTEPGGLNLTSGTRSFTVTNVTSGTVHTVTPTAATYTSIASSNYNVGSGLADHLTITTQPTTTVAGVEIAPVLEIRDQFENIVTAGADSTAVVTLNLQQGSGTLGGTVAKAAVGGIVDFTGLGVNINLVGTDKILRATKADTSGSGGTASLTEDTSVFTITHAAASQIAFVAQPSATYVAGVEIAPQFAIQDSFGNTVTTGADATASLTLSLQQGAGALGGTVVENASAGTADFSGNGVYINLVGADKILRVTKADTSGSGGTGVITNDSNTFAITHAIADHLTYTTAPTTTVAGVEIAPVVEVRDQYNNVVSTGPDATVSLTMSLQQGAGVLSGTVAETTAAGTADWSGNAMSINLVGTDKILRVTKPDTTGSGGTVAMNLDSSTFTVLHAAADHLTVTTQPSASYVAGNEIAPVLEVRDQFENVVTSGADSSVNVTLSLQQGAGSLGGTVVKTAASGIIDFTGLSVFIDLVGTDKILRFSKPDTSGSGGTSGMTVDTNTFSVTYAAVNTLEVTGISDPTIAGTQETVVVRAQDVYTNTVENYTGTIAFVSSDGSAILPSNYTFLVGDLGSKTFTNGVELRTTGEHFVNATDTSVGTVTGSQSAITVNPAAADHLTFATQPSATVAGQEISLIVEVRDQFENVVVSGADATANITLNLQQGSGALGGTLVEAASSGVASFSGNGVNINLVGTDKILRATKADTSGGGGTTSFNEDSNTFTITHAPADHLTFTTQPPTTVAGVEIAPVLEIRDQYENVVTTGADATANVTFNLQQGSGTLGGTVVEAASAGIVDFNSNSVNINLVGTDKILRATKADTSGGGGTASFNLDSNTFTITHAPADHLTFTTQPPTTVAGVEIAPVLEIRDQYENVVTTGADATANVTFNLQQGSGTLGGTVVEAASAGIVNFASNGVNIDLVGTDKILRATKADTSGGGGTASFNQDSNTFTITNAAAFELVYTTAPSASYVAGVEIAPVVEIRDQYGNAVTAGPDATANVTLTLQQGSGSLGGTVVETASAGVASFSGNGAFINLVGTDKILRATKADTSGSGGTTSQTKDTGTFTITHAPAGHLTFTTQPPTTVAGVEIAPVLEIRDQYENVVTTGADATANVTFNLQQGSGTLGGTVVEAASAGIVDFNSNGVNINLVGTDKILRATKADTSGSGGTTSFNEDSNTFTITHAPADHLTFTTQPPTTVAGVEIAPVLEIRDQYENVVTTGADATANVTFNLQQGSGTLGGTVVEAASAGIVNFASNGVNIDLVGTDKILRATKADTSGGGGTASFNQDSNTFTITNAAAFELVYTTAPGASYVAGIEIAPVVEIRDQYGNAVTVGPDATANVTLTLQQGSGSLGGTVVEAASSGVANFSSNGVFINLVGTDKILRATKADTSGSGGTTSQTKDTGTFTITHAPADHLTFTTQPSTTVAGVEIAPVLEIRDQYENVVTTGADATANVTFNLQQGSGTLGGTVVEAASAGIVDFTSNSVNINLVGTDKILRATKADTSGGGGTASFNLDSNTFTITHAPADHLTFTTQPPTTVAGVEIAPVLEIRDQYENVVTTGADATANVTFNLQQGSGTLGGTVVEAASAGIVDFTSNSVNINLVGTDKILRATKADTSGGGGTTSFNEDSNTFTITHAPADHLTFTTQPPTTVAGVEIAPVLEIRDQYENVVTTGADATANVTFNLQQGSGTLGGTVVEAASAGIVDFTSNSVNINLVGTDKILRATKADTSGGGGTTSFNEDSNTFTITHAPADHLTFTTQPPTTVAGVEIAPVLEIRDQYENVVTTGADATANVTFNLQQGSGTLGGTVVETASSGIVNFASNGVNIDLVGTDKILRATKADTSGGGGTSSFNQDSNTFTITNAAAFELVYTTAPSASYVAGVEIAPVVEIRDQYGNAVTVGPDATANVTLTLQQGSGALGGTVVETASAGVASFSGNGAFINLVGTDKILRATKADTSGSGGTTSQTKDTGTFTITHAPADHLTFTTQPPTTVAGVEIAPVLEIRDQYENVVTTGADATANVTFNLQQGSGTLGGTVVEAASAGIVDFNSNSVNINLVGTDKILRATKADTSGGGGTASFNLDSNTFTITHAPADHLTFTTQPPTTVAGVEIAPVLEIRDQYENVVTTGADATANVTFNLQQGSGTLGGTVVEAASAGIVNFASNGVNIDLVGADKIIRATKADTSGGGGTASFNQDSNTFTITNAAAFELVYTTAPSASYVAGVEIAPVVEIRDQYGNAVTAGPDATANVTLTLQQGSGSLGGTVVETASAGVANFSSNGVFINLVGTDKILRATKADTSGGGGTASQTKDTGTFTITHAPADHLTFTTQPPTTVAGVEIAPVLEIRDQYENVVTTGADATANVTFNLQQGSGTLGGTVVEAASAGIVDFTSNSVNINLVGTDKILRATKADTSGGGGTTSFNEDSNTFTITHAPADHLTFTTQPPTTVAGVEIAPVLEIRDQYENVVTTGADATANVTFNLQQGSGTLGGTVVEAASAGIVDFNSNGVNINLVGTDKILRATKADTSGGGGTTSFNEDSNTFTITHAPADHLTFTTQPPTTVAGVEIAPVLEIRDQYENVVTTGADATANVTFNLQQGSGTLGGTVVEAASAGIVDFNSNGVNINLVGTDKILRATKADTSGGGGTTSFNEDSNTFTITHAPADHLTFTTQPPTTVAGVEIAPVLEIRDQYENVVTTGADATANVTFNLQQGSGTLGGTVVEAASAGIVDFNSNGVNINLVGTDKILRATKADTSGGGGTASFNLDSNTFTITHAPADHLTFTTQPPTTVAGVEIAPVLEIRDQYENVVTTGADATANVTFNLQQGSGTLGGTVVEAASAGIVDFNSNGVNINLVGTDKILRATKADTSGGGGTASFNQDSNTFTITHASATTLTVAGVADPVVAGTDEGFTVTAVDTFGNTDEGYTGTVTFSTSDGAAVVRGNYTFLGADNGQKVFASGIELRTVGEQTFTATDTVTGTITGTQSAITVQSAAPQTIVLSGASAVSSGACTLISIQLEDSYGNNATVGSNTTLNLTGEGGGGFYSNSGCSTSTSSVVVSSGTGTQQFYYQNIGEESVTLQADDTGSLTAGAHGLTTSAGSATQLIVVLPGQTHVPGQTSLANAVTGAGTTATAGSGFSVDVIAVDAYYNKDTSFAGSHYVRLTYIGANQAPGTSDNPTKPADGNKSFTAGSVSLSSFVLVNASDTASIQADICADGATCGSVTQTGTSSDIPIQAGALNYVVVRDQSGGAGSAVGNVEYSSLDSDPTFYAAGYDIYGNYKSDQTVTWKATRSTSGDLDASLSSTSGSSTTLDLSNAGAGTVTILADSASATDDSTGTQTIYEQGASQFLVELVSAGDKTVGVGFDVRVTAQTPSTSTATNYAGSKTMNWSTNGSNGFNTCGAGTLTPEFPSTSLTFTAGVATTTASFLLKRDENSVTITADDSTGTISGTSSTFNVNAGSFNCIKLSDSANNTGSVYSAQTINIDQELTVYATGFDAYGNFVADQSVTWSGTGVVADVPNPATGTSTGVVGVQAGSGVLQANAGAATLNFTVNAGTSTWTSSTTDSNSNNRLGSSDIKSVFYWDVSSDSVTAWRTAGSQSWYSETSSGTRGPDDAFPLKAHLVATASGLDIVDALTNDLFMRFSSGVDYAIDSDFGAILDVEALNGRIYVAQASGLTILDFDNDELYQTNSSGAKKSDKNLSQRNSAGSWSVNATYPTLSSSSLNDLATHHKSGTDYIALGTSSAVDLLQDGGTVSLYSDATSQSVVSVALTDDEIYYAEDTVGVHRSDVTLPLSANFTPSRTYTESTDAELPNLDVNSIEISLGTSSADAGENVIAVGTENGLAILHEHSTLSSSTSKIYTYDGTGETTFNGAVHFDGTDDYASAPDKTSRPTTVATIEFWFRPNGAYSSGSGQTVLIQKGDGSKTTDENYGIELNNGTGALDFYVVEGGSATTISSSTTSWTAGQWYHVAATFDGVNGIKLWVDGSYEGNSAIDVSGWSGNTGNLYIGSDEGSSDFFAGAMDELRLTNNLAYTGTSSITVPSSAFTDDANTIYLYHFDESSGTSAADSDTGDAQSATLSAGSFFATPFFHGDTSSISGMEGVTSGGALTLHIWSSDGSAEIRTAEGTPSVNSSQTSYTPSDIEAFQIDSATDHDLGIGKSTGLELDRN